MQAIVVTPSINFLPLNPSTGSRGAGASQLTLGEGRVRSGVVTPFLYYAFILLKLKNV